MKRFATFIAIIIVLAGCKKKIEDIQQDLVVKAMTYGQWVITSFTQNSNNITSAFTPYKFKYYSNKTVDAINNGKVEKTGSWDGNFQTRDHGLISQCYLSFNTNQRHMAY